WAKKDTGSEFIEGVVRMLVLTAGFELAQSFAQNKCKNSREPNTLCGVLQVVGRFPFTLTRSGIGLLPLQPQGKSDWVRVSLFHERTLSNLGDPRLFSPAKPRNLLVAKLPPLMDGEACMLPRSRGFRLPPTNLASWSLTVVMINPKVLSPSGLL